MLVRIIQEKDGFPDQFFFDVRPSLKRVRIEGMYLDEQELFDLRRSLETIRDIVRFLHRNEDEEGNNTPYPSLQRLAGDIAVFPQLIGKIDGILNKYGKIKDNASTELARIRRELASTMGNISRSLNSILRSAQSEGYVDKDVAPTMRDGRLVIPVAPGLKRKIKGIVHDESASGKTVFIEPAEVVEANNRIRELEGDERREIIRILTEFSNILRPSIPEILQSYEFLAEIDFIRAKSYFAIQTNSLKPAVENEQLLDWTMAVHPLLQLSLAKHGKKVVPLDIELDQKQRILTELVNQDEAPFVTALHHDFHIGQVRRVGTQIIFNRLLITNIDKDAAEYTGMTTFVQGNQHTALQHILQQTDCFQTDGLTSGIRSHHHPLPESETFC